MGYVWQRWIADALRAEGCKVKEESGWENRGRPSSTGSWNPYGTLHHHTATHASYSNPHPTLNMCINGRSDLPGPLCQVLIGYDGVCHVIAAGRANHGGEHSGWGPFPSGDCNAMMMGWEIDYDGTQPISSEQKDAATRASAASLKHFKHNEDYAATHKETSVTGKWDTGGISGGTWRNLIHDRLAGGGETPQGDEDMPDYVSASSDSATIEGDEKWHSLKWTDISSDEENVIGAGEYQFRLGGRKYSAMFNAQVSLATGERISTRTVEVEKNSNGEWIIKEENRSIEHPRTSGDTFIQDARVGWVAKNRALRWQVLLPADAKVNAATAIIFW